MTWGENERGLLEAEISQRRVEGCAVLPSIVDAARALTSSADIWGEARTARLWQALAQPRPDAALERAEPDEPDAIRALRPACPRDLDWQPQDGELIDRLHCSWTGRYVMAMEGGRSVGRARILERLDARRATAARLLPVRCA